MLTLGLISINTTLPTHFSRTCDSLLDLIFVNNLTKVIKYEQLVASVFSKHDVLFMTYEVPINRRVQNYTYPDFKGINSDFLNYIVNNIQWDLVYSYENVDDPITFIENNINYV